jgi:formate-nitrite transporter family protein
MSYIETVRLKNTVNDQDHVAGPADAAVTLVEYGNFECIHCGQAFPVIKELQKRLGENLRFVFRHFPTVRIHPRSLRAAEAAEAAGAQDKFWAMHDALFTHQQALSDADLVHYAKRIGLDVERFSRDLAAGSYAKLVEAEYNHSLLDEHITGTPTFYINGVRYTGARELNSFLSAIEEADTSERIKLSASEGNIKEVLRRLHRRSKS